MFHHAQTESELIAALHAEGFCNVEVVEIEPKERTGKHTHSECTVHVILEGEITISDPRGKTTYKAGDRVEFPKGTIHTAIPGPKGVKMIVGFTCS